MKHKTQSFACFFMVFSRGGRRQFDQNFSVNTNIDYCEAQAFLTWIVPSGSEGGILTRSMEMMLIGISLVPVHGLQVSGLVFFGIYMRIQKD